MKKQPWLDTIRRMSDAQRSPQAIAEHLNSSLAPHPSGKPWTRYLVLKHIRPAKETKKRSDTPNADVFAALEKMMRDDENADQRRKRKWREAQLEPRRSPAYEALRAAEDVERIVIPQEQRKAAAASYASSSPPPVV